MAKIRIGFSSDFVLENSEVGIGTTNPTAKLQVVDTLKGDFNITGVSTLRVYGGFAAQKQNITKDSSIGFSTTGIGTVGITSFISVNERETGFTSLVGEYDTVSEDLIVDEGKIFEISTTNITGITTLGTQEVYAPDDSVVSVGTLESVSIQSHFSVPDGGINDRPDQPTEGMVRFNDDLNTLEFYNGIEWRQFTVSGASGRGVIAGGVNGPGAAGVYSDIEYLNIQSLGNTQSFGDLTVNKYAGASMSSSTRGVFAGGWAAPVNNYDIEYITIASEGNAIDWTQNNTGGWGAMGASSSTRGLSAGGDYPTATATIDSIQFSTIGSKEDWGDITALRGRGTAGCNSPTRAIFFGGYAPVQTSNIEFKQTASNSNTVFFGDLLNNTSLTGGGGNSVRGIICGSYQRTPATYHKIIQYITIATTGNAQYFGDLSDAKSGSFSVSDQIRNVNFGGYNGSSWTNTIEYITIATAGNTEDFGDLSKPGYENMGVSDSHGGLGGF